MNVNMPNKIRKGFSYEEAILMAKFSLQAYEIFQHDDKSIEDTDLKEIYNAMYRNEKWRWVHSVRNYEMGMRGFIVRNAEKENQYVVSFRGSIVSDRGMAQLTNFFYNVQSELVAYEDMTDETIKVTQGFYKSFKSVEDQIELFFKTLLGRLKPKDIDRLYSLLPPSRQFLCATALANAGAIRLGADFEQKVTALIHAAVTDGEIGNDDDVRKILDFVKQPLLDLPPLETPLEIYVTGHSLGGTVTFLCALALRRWFGPVEKSGVAIKAYPLAGPKAGNPEFARYYTQTMGQGLTYRIENTLDVNPQFPPNVPLVTAFAPNGLKIGNLTIGNYANGGDAHYVTGLGSQSASLSFGGIVEIPGGVPFPHSNETYLQLLEEQQLFWHEAAQPLKSVLSPLLKELQQEEVEEISDRTEAAVEAMTRKISNLIEGLQTPASKTANKTTKS